MKRFTVPCDFAGEKHPFHVYIGRPSTLAHPLYYQTLWLKRQRNGIIPEDVIQSFMRILDIANENGVSFEDLAVYSLGEAQKEDMVQEDGNVVRLDFQAASAFAKSQNPFKSRKSKAEDVYLPPSFQFFDAITLNNENTRLFCGALASLLVASKSAKATQQQSQELAEHLLAATLYVTALICASTDKKKKPKENPSGCKNSLAT